MVVLWYSVSMLSVLNDTVQCVVVFTDVQSGNTTVGHTPGTHPPMGSKVITVPQAGIYNITVYE